MNFTHIKNIRYHPKLEVLKTCRLKLLFIFCKKKQTSK